MTYSFSHRKHTSNIYYKEMIDLLQGEANQFTFLKKANSSLGSQEKELVQYEVERDKKVGKELRKE